MFSSRCKCMEVFERRPPRWPSEREVEGSIPDRPKSLKLVVVAPSPPPFALRIMGIAILQARQCQDNGLVKYWLKTTSGKHGFVNCRR